MCQFFSTLPTQSNTAESAKKRNLQVFLKPTEEKQYYRFRLLAFRSPSKNERDYPFIERYVHTAWGVNADGKNVVESQVVCPITSFARSAFKGDPYDICPICRFANQSFAAFKESGYKNKEAGKNNRTFSRKFEAIVPVYVVSDPNYEANKDQFKVIIFTDKDEYKQFKEVIRGAQTQYTVFNGGEAVDFYLRVEDVEEVRNEGMSNEYRWKHRKITKMGFTNKPYAISAITKEAVDNFPFDDQYFVVSTMEELKAFYDKYIAVSNDDIPEDDEPVIVQPPKKAAKPAVKAEDVIPEPKPVAKPKPEVVVDDLPFPDWAPKASSETGANEEPKAKKSAEDEINELFNEIDAI